MNNAFAIIELCNEDCNNKTITIYHNVSSALARYVVGKYEILILKCEIAGIYI